LENHQIGVGRGEKLYHLRHMVVALPEIERDDA